MTQNEGEREHSESLVKTRNHMEDPPYCAAYIRSLIHALFLSILLGVTQFFIHKKSAVLFVMYCEEKKM